mmetsp:Transcript_1808/g.3242  ORF Transcript_1808/g.3242 Transcript_1808/m.3242 type:complete len:173 (+) Transcript_1808:67-585(+)
MWAFVAWAALLQILPTPAVRSATEYDDHGHQEQQEQHERRCKAVSCTCKVSATTLTFGSQPYTCASAEFPVEGDEDSLEAMNKCKESCEEHCNKIKEHSLHEACMGKHFHLSGEGKASAMEKCVKEALADPAHSVTASCSAEEDPGLHACHDVALPCLGLGELDDEDDSMFG